MDSEDTLYELVDSQGQQGTVDLQQDMPNVRLGAGSRLATQADREQVAQESPTAVKELLQRCEDFVRAVTQDIIAEVQCQPKVHEKLILSLPLC